jgi:3-deoxy-D-manno-octulosonic-acid transferase
MFIYNFIIKCYQLIIFLASFFNPKAKLWIAGRKNIFENIRKAKPEGKIAWFHCASLGEFEQGRPVMESFRKEFPEFKIFLTFFSPSGYEVRKNYNQAEYIFYLPVDTEKNAIELVNLIKPSIAFFVKYEFWYHYIAELKKQNIPVFSISAIFRSNQIFFKNFAKWYLHLLEKFSYIFVQNSLSKEILEKHGILKVMVTGDTRFDRVYEIGFNAKQLPLIEKFVDQKFTIVAGSTWQPDEDIVINYINLTNHPVKLIIAPHEIHASNIYRICKVIRKKVIKYSEANEQNISDYDVLVIDNVGMLSSIYKYGKAALVGGAFKTGLHNVLEPATHGVPVICGPIYSKFQEATDLVKTGGLFTVQNYVEFETILDRLVLDSEFCKKTGKIAKDYVSSNRGATEKIILYIKKYLKFEN